nr:hypothetical protein [Tanacetum cinerariifolium]
MILFGADNRPPMLDKDLERSDQNKEYAELSVAEKIQADCDMKDTNTILQELPLIQETKPLFKTAGLQCNKFRGDKGKIILELLIRPKRPRNAAWYKGKAMLAKAQEARQILDEEQLAFLADPGIPAGQAQTIIPHNAAFQTEDLDTYDSDCDDLSTAQAVLMANISNYGSDIISEERVKTFEQPLNIDLSCHEKMIDSQMDDMIKEKLVLKEKVDLLEQNLSKQIKEKECLLETFNVFKNESKEKENQYLENEIDLEQKITDLDNIVYKVGQSAQTVHMLTKPRSFYDIVHKQALGYQNSFYLKKAQWIKPTLYDGTVISEKHVAMPVIDDEETLI